MPKRDDPSTCLSLLRALGDNSEEAWRRFLPVYQPLIYRWCCQWGLQHADAEEVSAAVLAKLARAMRSFRYDPQKRFRHWLKSVVANTVRDSWRELKRKPGAVGDGGTDAQEMLAQVEDENAVTALVQTLDEGLEHDLRLAEQVTAAVQARVEPHTWQAFWLTAIEGRTAAEAAARLDMKVAAVYVAKNRVGKMLLAAGARASPSEGEGAAPA
jgi:RNA polymerase sigma factor (sigma-70 family)